MVPQPGVQGERYYCWQCFGPERASLNNYRPFYDAGERADSKVERIYEAGVTVAGRAQAALGPDMVINKLSCVSKVKIPGDVKARLVTDLHRSGGNGRLKIHECVVLPRVLDLVYSVVRLLEAWEDISLVELATVDFTDAFHTIWLDKKERPLCVFESGGVYYVYLRLPFGLASAPLIWGRLAAAAFRIVQSMAWESEYESHCYVDDPGLVLAGSSAWCRKLLLARILLLLMCFGLDISWMKA